MTALALPIAYSRPAEREFPTSQIPAVTDTDAPGPSPGEADIPTSQIPAVPDSDDGATAAAPPSGGSEDAQPQGPAGPQRNRYFDSLRAVALLRVLLFHLLGWFWLPLIFPSMGVMFALAGSLMAASLDRSPSVSKVIGRRLRRLLPPLVVMGAILVPIMLTMGWTAEQDGAREPGLSLLNWVLPLTQPPASDLGYQWTIPLWYLTAYLWLVLLSPAMLWLWRRWPIILMMLPLVGVALISATLLQAPGPIGSALTNTLIYAASWMVGFAHHDGALQRISFPKVVAGGLVLCAAGLLFAIRHPLPGSETIAVGDIPMAAALFNLGFALILLRVPTTFQWAQRNGFTRNLLTMVNRRALTIYIWGNVAIAATWPALSALPMPAQFYTEPVQSVSAVLMMFALLSVVILLLGWVEDLAAGKRPAVFPTAGTDRRSATSRRSSRRGRTSRAGRARPEES